MCTSAFPVTADIVAEVAAEELDNRNAPQSNRGEWIFESALSVRTCINISRSDAKNTFATQSALKQKAALLAQWRLTGAMVVDWRIRARAESDLASRLDRYVPLAVVASPSVRAFDRKGAPLGRQCIGEDGALCSFIAVRAGMQFDQRALAETFNSLVRL
jgi:hypothetical protein